MSNRKKAKIRRARSGVPVTPLFSLVAAGAPAPRCLARGAPDLEELGRWVDRWLPTLVRRVAHPGNHKYAFPLDRGTRRHVGAPNPGAYPKRVPA